MSALEPPRHRLWWKQPLDRVEGTWIVIAFVWCLVMFFMMPWWHVYGKQNLANEAYRSTPEMFQKKTDEMVARHTILLRNGAPITDKSKLWVGRLQHGFSLQPENINIQVHPGYEHVLTITPTTPGTYSIVCNEYCGINHHTMVSRLYVVK